MGDALAAVSALLDRAETDGQAPSAYGLVARDLAELAEVAGAYGAGAFAGMLRVRVAWLEGDVDRAQRLAQRQLESLAEQEPAEPDPFVGADWTSPVHVGDRDP